MTNTVNLTIGLTDGEPAMILRAEIRLGPDKCEWFRCELVIKLDIGDAVWCVYGSHGEMVDDIKWRSTPCNVHLAGGGGDPRRARGSP